MKLLAIFGAIIFVCFYTTRSSADIYSWTDESGITHFTNYSPPPVAKLIIKDMPVARSKVPEKETVAEDSLAEGIEIKPYPEEDEIQIKRKKVEASEEEPYSSKSDYPDVSGSDGSKNSYVSEFPPGSHRYPAEWNLLKHHPNYHYKYNLDKPYIKKSKSDFHRKHHYNKPTIWDRKPTSHKKRVFGWQPPKARGRPSAHYFAFGGGHYRGTTVPAKGRFGGSSSAFGGKGRFGGHRAGR